MRELNLDDFSDEDVKLFDFEETSESETDEPNDELKVVYIINLGLDHEGLYTYQFLIAEDESNVWGEEWNEKPAGNCRNLTPAEDMYQYVKELKCGLVFDLAQDNSCYSMQDVRDHIVCLASENLDDAEEYPEKGRIVIQFGDTLDDVEKMLGKRDLFLRFVE